MWHKALITRTEKPWKQKGTGRARAGTIRSPIWKGGGVTFAHTYQNVKPKKINRKMYRSAMRSIWSKLAEEEKIIAINDISIDSPPKSSQVIWALLQSHVLSHIVLSILAMNEIDSRIKKTKSKIIQLDKKTNKLQFKKTKNKLYIKIIKKPYPTINNNSLLDQIYREINQESDINIHSKKSLTEKRFGHSVIKKIKQNVQEETTFI